MAWIKVQEDIDQAGQEGLWDAQQTADYLGVAYSTLRQMVCYRRIPFIKIGRRCLFDPMDVRAWIDERRVNAVGKGGSRNE